MFNFLIQNSNVEWSRFIFDDGKVHLSTSRDEGADAYINHVVTYRQDLIKKLLIFDHSHTNGHIYPSIPDISTDEIISRTKDSVITRIFNGKIECFRFNKHTPKDETLNEVEVRSNVPKKIMLIPCKNYRNFVPQIVK